MRVVRKTKLAELDELLTHCGLKKPADEPYNLPGGSRSIRRVGYLFGSRQKGIRQNALVSWKRASLMFGLMKDRDDTSFDAEMVKFSPVCSSATAKNSAGQSPSACNNDWES